MKKADREYLDRVASLGCIVCRNEGLGATPANIHHLRTGQGLKRATHREVIPLCPQHHQHGGHGVAFHAGAKTWQAKYGTEAELLKQVQKLLEVFA